jgi:methionine sulfoxide reductase heme-binding subunit
MDLIWLKLNCRWGALNLFAVLTSIFVLTQGSTDWNRPDTFDPGLESGKWAIRFLLACLAMTPLNTYFGWSSAIKLRKSAGLWAFGFASLHILLYVREADLYWLIEYMPSIFAFGLTGIVILGALAITSNRWSMQRLGKNWKRLHRLVYLAGIAVLTHSMLASTMSKKMMGRDPQAVYELRVYLVLLSALLVIRIPLVRQVLRQIPTLLKRYRKSITPINAHDSGAELWPKIHGRESSVSVSPTFIIPNEIPNLSERNTLGKPFGRIDGLESYENRLSVEIPPEAESEIQEAVPN